MISETQRALLRMDDEISDSLFLRDNVEVDPEGFISNPELNGKLQEWNAISKEVEIGVMVRKGLEKLGAESTVRRIDGFNTRGWSGVKWNRRVDNTEGKGFVANCIVYDPHGFIPLAEIRALVGQWNKEHRDREESIKAVLKQMERFGAVVYTMYPKGARYPVPGRLRVALK